MAYPVRRHQQYPPNSSVRYTEDQYSSAPQQNSSEYSYRNGVPDRDVYNYPYTELPPRRDGGYPRTGNVGPNHGSSQWSEHEGTWAPEANQPYVKLYEDGHNQEIRPYGPRRSPPDNAHYQYQDSRWGNPLPHQPSQQQQHFPPENGYDTVGRSTGDYGYIGAPSRTNAHNGPQNLNMTDRSVGVNEYDSVAERRPQNPIYQQQQSRAVQDRRVNDADYLSPRDHQPTEIPRQPRIANPGNEKSKKPGELSR